MDILEADKAARQALQSLYPGISNLSLEASQDTPWSFDQIRLTYSSSLGEFIIGLNQQYISYGSLFTTPRTALKISSLQKI